MAGGRPTLYTEDMPQKVMDYIASQKDIDVPKREGKDFTEYKKQVHMPTMQSLAVYLGITKATMYEWSKLYPEFSYSLEQLIAEQHARLLENSLSGDYNSTIAKLVLSSNHGYVERRDVTTEGKSIVPSGEQKAEADKAINTYLDGGAKKDPSV